MKLDLANLTTYSDRDVDIVEALRIGHQATPHALLNSLSDRPLALDDDPARLVTRLLRLAAMGAACVEAAINDPDQPVGPAVLRIDPALRGGL